MGPHLPLAQQPAGEVTGVAARPVPPQRMAQQEVVVLVGAQLLLPALAQAPLLLAVGVVGAAHPPHLLPQPAQVLQGRAVLVVVVVGPQPAALLLQAAPGLVLAPLSLLVSLLLLQLLVHRSQSASHP